MTSSSTPALFSHASAVDHLHGLIPHLKADGTNWAMFCMCFQEARDTAGCWGYFDGTAKRPVPADEDKPTSEEKEAVQRWIKEDQLAQLHLTQRLPEDTAMEMFVHKMAKERWDTVKQEFMVKSKFARNDLKQEFLEMCCPKGGDVRAFLTSLRTKRNQAKAAGVTISDDDYKQTVLRSIPDELAKFTVSTQMSAQVSGNTLDMNFLIQSLCEEADRLKSHHAQRQHGQGKGREGGQTDEALAITNVTNSSNNHSGQRKCRQGNCHNCGKAGHWARECRAPKKEESANTQLGQASSSTTPKPNNKLVGSANAVVYGNDEGDGFWMVEEMEEEVAPAHVVSTELDPLLYDPDDFEAPSAELDSPEVFFSWNGPEDWLDKEGEDWDLEEAEDSELEEGANAVITPIENDNSLCIELYDSGATCHISPLQVRLHKLLTSVTTRLPEHRQSAVFPGHRERNPSRLCAE
jgi:gag-polypeptide of LTR copia-type/Zinc knuckle